LNIKQPTKEYMIQHLKELYETARVSRKLIYFLFAAFLLSLLYPSDLSSYPKNVDRANPGFLVNETEDYLRCKSLFPSFWQIRRE
jgi:hypothetical protein